MGWWQMNAPHIIHPRGICCGGSHVDVRPLRILLERIVRGCMIEKGETICNGLHVAATFH